MRRLRSQRGSLVGALDRTTQARGIRSAGSDSFYEIREAANFCVCLRQAAEPQRSWLVTPIASVSWQ